jgi:hypothetical protein
MIDPMALPVRYHADFRDRHRPAERRHAGGQAADVGQAQLQRAADAAGELARLLRDLKQPRQHLAQHRRQAGTQHPPPGGDGQHHERDQDEAGQTEPGHRGGAWIGSLPELPAIAANTRISRTCRTNATTWATPTLAAATAAEIFCRWAEAQPPGDEPSQRLRGGDVGGRAT